MIQIVKIVLLAFIQNISSSMVSRSRNRDSKMYHIIAAIFSNSMWYLTFRELMLGGMGFKLFIPYILGTVVGSTFGMTISMRIERWLGASTDSHLKKTNKK